MFVDGCARAELEDGDGRYRDGTGGVLEVRGIRDSEGALFSEVECQLMLRFLSCLGGLEEASGVGSSGVGCLTVSWGYRAKTVVSSEAASRTGREETSRDGTMRLKLEIRDAAVAQTGWVWLWLRGPLAQAGEI